MNFGYYFNSKTNLFYQVLQPFYFHNFGNV